MAYRRIYTSDIIICIDNMIYNLYNYFIVYSCWKEYNLLRKNELPIIVVVHYSRIMFTISLVDHS